MKPLLFFGPDRRIYVRVKEGAVLHLAPTKRTLRPFWGCDMQTYRKVSRGVPVKPMTKQEQDETVEMAEYIMQKMMVELNIRN